MAKEKKILAQKKRKDNKTNLNILYMNFINKLPKQISGIILISECSTLDTILQKIPKNTGDQYINLKDMQKARYEQQIGAQSLKRQEQILTTQNLEAQLQLNNDWKLEDQFSSSALNLPVGVQEIGLMRQQQNSIDFFL